MRMRYQCAVLSFCILTLPVEAQIRDTAKPAIQVNYIPQANLSIAHSLQEVNKISSVVDSAFNTLQSIPTKYIRQVEDKIDKYSSRVTAKTIKTLERLSRWEEKIKTLLEKASPETAQRLFANGQLTFSSLLQKVKLGEELAKQYKTKYDGYRDQLTGSLKYLLEQKDQLKTSLIQPLEDASKKMGELEQDIANTEAVEKYIRQRKRQLIDQAIKYIGNCKYLSKIDKESYYYIETLRNYRELFSDSKKTEELAVKLLNKIPDFQQFLQQNSRASGLFGFASSNANTSIAGLQTRESINALIQERIAVGGPNARRQISEGLQQAKAEQANLKNRVLKAGGTSSDAEIPNFKPNGQRSKTFMQRLEFGSNVQFAKNNRLVPTTADIALSLGYKLNDKSIIGLGASYRLGMGTLQRIRFTHEGIGVRSFVDWKLKKNFSLSGGFEMNYNAQFKNITQLQSYNAWQRSGLIGLTKKVNINTKLFKGSSIQLLFDMMYKQHTPVSQPILFRTGYTFK